MKTPFQFLVAIGLIALALFAGHDAAAAPFCTQITGTVPQCMYYDAGECRRRAKELKAICVANADEFHIVTGNARYCLVNGDHAAVCIYSDRQSCDKDATKAKQAVCLDNAMSNNAQDPFLTEPNRRY